MLNDSINSSTTILSASGVRLAENTPNIDAAIHEGEIVGIAGLAGHGQQLFLRTLCGLHTPFAGRIDVALKDGSVQAIGNLHNAAKAGVIYLPRERKTQGILPALSVLDNFAIATLPQQARFGFLKKQAIREQLEQFRQRLSMVFASPAIPITSLSGGNQQKVLLARWMAANPRVMLLDDPTRGVDMQTKLTLYEVFREMVKQERTTLVLLSTEIEEFLQLCDRTLVFHGQGVFAELDRTTTSRDNIIAAMFGRTT